MTQPVGGRGFRVQWDPQWEAKLYAGGEVRRALGAAGEIVTQGAKRRAAVSPDGSHGRPSGYMRSHIGWEHSHETGPNEYVDVGCSAVTPEGHAYPRDVEFGTRPHRIAARRADALAFHWKRMGFDVVVPKNATGHTYHRADGTLVVGKGYVDHPGTRAQPFLRPALDDLQGRKL
jgi:hypothetical protein